MHTNLVMRTLQNTEKCFHALYCSHVRPPSHTHTHTHTRTHTHTHTHTLEAAQLPPHPGLQKVFSLSLSASSDPVAEGRQ